LAYKETFADAPLTGIVSECSLQNSPLESSCVVVALIENYSTSKPLKVSPEKSHILSCDTVVANERYNSEFVSREKTWNFCLQVDFALVRVWLRKAGCPNKIIGHLYSDLLSGKRRRLIK
jgi:hypothetical protein